MFSTPLRSRPGSRQFTPNREGFSQNPLQLCYNPTPEVSTCLCYITTPFPMNSRTMNILRPPILLPLLLFFSLHIACGQRNDSPRQSAISQDQDQATSNIKKNSDESATQAEKEEKERPVNEPEHLASETNQEATFQVDGMVTRFGMV